MFAFVTGLAAQEKEKKVTMKCVNEKLTDCLLYTSIKGVILSGSPFSVYDKDAFKVDLSEIRGKYPILGICYGCLLYTSRIGRFVFRAAMKRNDIQIVGINDLCPVDYLAYMLKYDTMHGQFNGTIEADVENSKLIVNGQAIRITAERNPADLKWNEVGAEYVVESTGLFLSKDKAQAHIEAGAKYVVMSAPSKDDTPMFVCGVNEKTYVKGTQFVSNASCTTNCLAPIAKVLNDKWEMCIRDSQEAYFVHRLPCGVICPIVVASRLPGFLFSHRR